MRHRVLTGLVFALMMFTIPLLALNNTVKTEETLPNQNVQVQEPISSNASAPVKQPTVQAPATAVIDDGFRLQDEKTGKVLQVSARDYVRGSLAAEMPPTFHPEALKAQAVAAHTYALNVKMQSRAEKKNADFTVDTQNWKSYTTEKLFRERYGALAEDYWKSICSAADEVCSYILTYEDEPIVAAYHSMSNGFTEDASNVWTGGKPYLVPVESSGDILAPDYTSKKTLTVEETADALQKTYSDLELGDDPKTWFHINARSESGYVTELAVGNQIIPGKELRTLFDLRSSDFSVDCNVNTFTFTVNGYGHGVGLSQYGADYMARQGMTFDEILMHYYQGASLATVTS